MPSKQELPRRDFWVILVSLLVVTLLSWSYLFSMAADMSGGMALMQAPVWNGGYFLMMFFMWAVMMAGMMLPSVTPTVLIYAQIARKSAAQGTPTAPVGAFVSGYLLMWVGFSLLATTAQWGLDRAGLLSPMMAAGNNIFGGVLLMLAGGYQWLPVKNRCLEHCRSPVHFLSQHWRPGTAGALRMGLHHGAYCVGCCWVLMGLLFVGGVMNLLWIGALTLFVLLEKVLPFGAAGGRVMGLLLIVAGSVFVFVEK